MKTLKQMLYELTMDKDFVALKFLIDRPNVFHVVGATHLETWHSKFLSWLIDPTERHMLGYYPFQRFLMIVAQSATHNIDHITDIAMLNVEQFKHPEITAEKDINKLNITEMTDEVERVDWKGRLDVFFKVNYVDTAGDLQQLVLAVEQKVYAPVDQQQCEKYLRKFEETYREDTYLLVGLVPRSQLKDSNEETFGSSKWSGIDYQQLVDYVLMPCLENPDLNSYAKPIIQQYIDALRMPYKGKREKLATIQEERVLVQSLYDRFEDVFTAISSISKEGDSEERSYVQQVVNDTYGDVFRTIRWVLAEQLDEVDLWSFTAAFQRAIHKRSEQLIIEGTYNGTPYTIQGDAVPQLWHEALVWIEHQQLPLRDIIEEGLILGSSDRGKRYAISLKPVHPSRQKFMTERQYHSLTGDTYYIEAKISPEKAMQTILKLLHKLGVEAYAPQLNAVVQL